MSSKLENAFKEIGGIRKLVHVSDVPNGIACECNCPSCQSKLIAKNNPNNKVRAHFQHYRSKEHEYCAETSLHYLAKEVISEMKEIPVHGHIEHFKIPDNKYRGWGPLLDEKIEVLEPHSIKIDECYIEKRDGRIKPDLIIISGGRKIHFEVFVTHQVEADKKKYLKDNSIDCVEISLKHLHGSSKLNIINKETVTAALQTIDNSKWVNNEFVNEKVANLREEMERLAEEERQFRDEKFKRIDRPRRLKKHFEKYRKEASDWLASKNQLETKAIEEKYGYSIYKEIKNRNVMNCPLTEITLRGERMNSAYYCVNTCQYNAKLDRRTYENPFYVTEDNYTRCLHDLMQDRYYDQGKDDEVE